MFKFKKQKADCAQTEPQPEKNSVVSTAKLKQILGESPDIIFSDIYLGGNKSDELTVVFIEGMVDMKMVDDDVIRPLMQCDQFGKLKNEQEALELIVCGQVYHVRRKVTDSLDECINSLLTGAIVIVFDELKKAVLFVVKGFEKRAITETTNENVIKGSKESFIEVLRVNTALVRRRIQSKDLVIRQLSVGRRSNTNIAVIFLRGVTNMNFVETVTARLRSIDIDGVVAAGEVESYLADHKWSLFPQQVYTERVDKFCGNIMEGRVGVMIDGMPIAYLTPVDIGMFFQSPEDYSQHYYASTFFRLLRFFSALITILLPAFYVSITTFHQEMLPSKLAMAIIQSKEGVPFPVFIEVLVMLFFFEVLMEAGLRLPKTIGQAVSIVGALVVGEAAITAKIVSPGVVIVIAITGITGFVLPAQDMANTLRICRFLLVLCSIVAGLFGVSIGLIAIVYSVSKMETMGVPYLSPYVSNEGKEILNDSIIRLPWFLLKNRPSYLSPQDLKRQR